MKPLILSSILCFSSAVFAIEVIEPEVQTIQTISITSIDDQVATLGTVEFVVDIGSANDDNFTLKLRRSNLTLADGRATEVYGYSQKSGIIIASKSPVTHISVSGREGNNVHALFHNNQNEIIAPNPKDIRVFDLNMQPLDFEYTPTLAPNAKSMDVSILIDRSGSMVNAMPDVLTATREFMANLPDFTRCNVLTFGPDVTRLTPDVQTQLHPCPKSLWILNRQISVGGGTALYAAIDEALTNNAVTQGALPELMIVITDGVNTVNSIMNLQGLIALKEAANRKVLVFWAGAYDPTHLKGLADFESVSTTNVKSDLDAFFRTIGISINGMQTITLK